MVILNTAQGCSLSYPQTAALSQSSLSCDRQLHAVHRVMPVMTLTFSLEEERWEDTAKGSFTQNCVFGLAVLFQAQSTCLPDRKEIERL